MSIEQALKDLTEAVVLNTTALNNLLSSTATVAGSPSTTTASTDDADDTSNATEAESPKRERGKPSPGKAKRTAAEVAEDKAADEADAAAEVAEDKAADEADAAAAGDQGGDAVTFDELKVKLSKWLGEFSKPEDRENPKGAHPEVIARRDAIKAVLTKLGAEKLPDIAADAEKVGKLNTWLEEKALTADKGHGIGRLASDPEPAGDDEGDGGDELDI